MQCSLFVNLYKLKWMKLKIPNINSKVRNGRVVFLSIKHKLIMCNNNKRKLTGNPCLALFPTYKFVCHWEFSIYQIAFEIGPQAPSITVCQFEEKLANMHICLVIYHNGNSHWLWYTVAGEGRVWCVWRQRRNQFCIIHLSFDVTENQTSKHINMRVSRIAPLVSNKPFPSLLLDLFSHNCHMNLSHLQIVRSRRFLVLIQL